MSPASRQGLARAARLPDVKSAARGDGPADLRLQDRSLPAPRCRAERGRNLDMHGERVEDTFDSTGAYKVYKARFDTVEGE